MSKQPWWDHYIPEPNSGCWIWLGGVGITGYAVCLPHGRKGGQRKVHRLMYERYKEPIPDGMQACHRCDNRLCVNPDHIFIGTNTDNVNDMVRKGRQQRGEKGSMAKLTDVDVFMIRTSPKNGNELAREYGVRSSCISRIRTGKRRV